MVRGWVVGGLLMGCAAGGGDDSAQETLGLGSSGGSAASMSGTPVTGGMMTGNGPATGLGSESGSAGSGSGPSPIGCGDGMLDSGEQCDDGNRINADGCNADCRPSGELLWDETVGSGLGLVEEAFGVAPQDDGTFYVGGYMSSMAGLSDMWLRQYNAMGAEIWTMGYAGAAMSNDRLHGIALDDAGNFYTAGYETVTGEGANVWLRKHGPAGAEIWTRSYNGPNSSTDVALAVTIDGSGDVVVVGYANDAVESHDVFLRKYSADGDVQWTRTYTGPSAEIDLAWDIEPSPDGHLFVAGYETVLPDEARNAWLGKYDTDGNLIWSRTYNGAESLDDFFIGVETTPDSGAVVCGYEVATAYPWHYFVRKYDAAGMIVWTDEYPGATDEGAHCFGIKADGDGNLVTTGGEIVDGVRGVVVRKYDPDGAALWTRVFPGGATGPDYGRDVAIGNADLIHLVGAMNTGTDDRDAWVGVMTP